MKKATTKRERKYGKKEEKIVEEVKIKKKKKERVTVMVDYGMIRYFPCKEDADKFINKKHKEADKANRPRSSFIFI